MLGSKITWNQLLSYWEQVTVLIQHSDTNRPDFHAATHYFATQQLH